jgi:hypothetical protein
MSHLAVRTLIEDVAKSLADNIQFGYGRHTEFNQITNKRYPYIWLLPLNASRRFPSTEGTKTKIWRVSIMFLALDKADSNEKETAAIHDNLDVFVDRFLEALDGWTHKPEVEVDDYAISNDNQIPFYKDNTDVNSGWLLTFDITIPDYFDYCLHETRC